MFSRIALRGMVRQQSAHQAGSMGRDLFYDHHRRVIRRFQKKSTLRLAFALAGLLALVVFVLVLSQIPGPVGAVVASTVAGLGAGLVFLMIALGSRLESISRGGQLGWEHVDSAKADLAGATPEQLQYILDQAGTYLSGAGFGAGVSNSVGGVAGGLAAGAALLGIAQTLSTAWILMLAFISFGGIAMLINAAEPATAAAVLALAARHRLAEQAGMSQIINK